MTNIIYSNELDYNTWLNYILSDDTYKLLDNSRCFPSDEFYDEFIAFADRLTEAQIKIMLSRFLIKTGETNRDQEHLVIYNTEGIDYLGRESIKETQYYRRLVSDDDFAWEGISWVLDLLPDNPKMAIDVLNAYDTAHICILSDVDIHALVDAIFIIRTKFIDVTYPRDLFLNLTPRDFEFLVEALYIAMGYQTTLTPATRDGGLDIFATSDEVGRTEKLVIECKRHEADIGPDYIRALNGVVHSEFATKGVLVSSSDFTPESLHFAERNSIELINHEKLTKLLNLYLGTNWSYFLDNIIQERRREYNINICK